MKILFLMLTGLQLHTAIASGANFRIEWITDGLPISVEVQRLQSSLKARVGETGELNDKVQLPPGRPLKEQNLLVLDTEEDAYLLLLIKNKSDKKFNFAVAPHSTHPGEASLGFAFTCLCSY